MSNTPVTQNDIAQALSQTLIDISLGRKVDRSRIEKQIDVSDAINRRLQVKINMMKTMIEAKKNGVDFAASMKEINSIVDETTGYVGSINVGAESSLPTSDDKSNS